MFVAAAMGLFLVLARLRPDYVEQCTSPLDALTRQAVERLGDRLPARSAVVDVAVPTSESEATSLNQMGILAVRAFSRSRDDLPIVGASVVLAGRGSVVKLPLIFPKRTVLQIAPSSQWLRGLGEFLQEEYFFLPLRLLAEQGAVHLQYSGSQEDLPVANLPLPAERLRSLPPAKVEAEDETPDPEAVIGKIAGTYCVF